MKKIKPKLLLLLIIILEFFYYIAYINSSYWDPSYVFLEQPYKIHSLFIPMIIVFFYFLFRKIWVREEDILYIKVFSFDNIWMSAYMSLMLVGVGFLPVFILLLI